MGENGEGNKNLPTKDENECERENENNINVVESFIQNEILSNVNNILESRSGNEINAVHLNDISVERKTQGENCCQDVENILPKAEVTTTTKQPPLSTAEFTNSCNEPSTSRSLPGPSNNSVILIFTQINKNSHIESENTAENNTDISVTTSRQESSNLPDYSAVLNMIRNETTNKYNLFSSYRPFDRPDVEIILTPPSQTPVVQQGPPPVLGAPPSYSAVLRLGPIDPIFYPDRSRRPQIRIQPSPPFIAPPPPPSYAEVQGQAQYSPRDIYPIFDEYIWGPDPLLIYCPRCTTIVQTQTFYRRSNLTHFSALALCLCGCWPCCLFPYCMKSCKNTYHHCPHCQTYLGMYSPW